MSDTKRENLFAKLAEQNRAREVREDGGAAEPGPAEAPSPAPTSAAPSPTPPAPRKGQAVGKRNHPDYCQANAYVPKRLRLAVEKALLDLPGLDYSGLVTDLLGKWLESRGVSE